MSSPMFSEEPEHFPMEVYADGQGPADEAEAVATVCWCGKPGCIRYLNQWVDTEEER